MRTAASDRPAETGAHGPPTSARPRPDTRTPRGERRYVSRHERREQVALETAARQLLERASESVGIDRDAEVAWPPSGLDSLERALTGAIEQAIAGLHEPTTPRRRLAGLAELLVTLEAMRGRLRERRMAQRVEALESIEAALNRLRRVEDPAALLTQVPEAICEACGLERGVLSRVNDGKWTVEEAYFDGEDAWAQEFVELGRRTEIELDHSLLETEMMRRRAPAVVHDAQHNPLAHKPLVSHADVQAYVSAPIMPANQVIGFVHGDYYFSGRDVDSHDRDTLWAFAQGLAHVYERAVLLQRLRAQRDQVRVLLSSADAAMTELTEAGVAFATSDECASVTAARSRSVLVAPESRLEALVTRREFEVLGLMAGGATNQEIAQKLFIAEGTVKTHVKHILRKLRAANRAEAVSRYLHMSFRADNDPRAPDVV